MVKGKCGSAPRGAGMPRPRSWWMVWSWGPGPAGDGVLERVLPRLRHGYRRGSAVRRRDGLMAGRRLGRQRRCLSKCGEKEPRSWRGGTVTGGESVRDGQQVKRTLNHGTGWGQGRKGAGGVHCWVRTPSRGRGVRVLAGRRGGSVLGDVPVLWGRDGGRDWPRAEWWCPTLIACRA